MNERTPKEKGYRIFKENKIKLIQKDDYELRFFIKDDFAPSTELSFIRHTFEIICYNKECCLYRGQQENKPVCHHIFAVRAWLNGNLKNDK